MSLMQVAIDARYKFNTCCDQWSIGTLDIRGLNPDNLYQLLILHLIIETTKKENVGNVQFLKWLTDRSKGLRNYFYCNHASFDPRR